MNKILKSIWQFVTVFFVYLLLVFDRAILVLFPFVTSYSAQELKDLPNAYSSYVVLRTSITSGIVLILLLIKLIF